MIEEFVRQCTIDIDYVYEATGNIVIAMRASAMMDDELVCSVVSDGRLRSSNDLEVLLAALGGKIAVAAKENSQ